MGLNIYVHDGQANSLTDTPVYRSCNFNIGIKTSSNMSIPAIHNGFIRGITGIANDTSSIGYSIEWGNSSGAAITDKIKEFTRAKAFKMFGGPKFDPNVATNSWTQQIPKDGSTVQITLNFRAYKQGLFMNTSSYLTIIPWLTYVTSPRHPFKFKTELENIRNAITNAKQKGEELGEALSGIVSDDKSVNSDALTKAAASLKAVENLLKGLTTSSRGNVTFTVSVGDIIRQDASVDWIITSWTFQPCMEFTEGGYPLWCDFSISLETNEKLSNSKMNKILF